MSWLAVTRRELGSLVVLPQTYGIAAAYVLISGIFFLTFFSTTRLPDLEQYYSNIATTLIVLAPVVAMRSFAEERRTGALDVTLSWPLSRRALVLGKYAVNTVYSWVLISVAWVYIRLLSGLGYMELGKAVAGFVGLLMLAAAFNAVALAVSARASSPAAAAFGGFGLLLALWTLQFGPGWLGQESAAGRLARWLAPSTHLEAAARGVLDLADVSYFGAAALIGIGLAVHFLEGARAGRRAYRLPRGQARLAFIGITAVVLNVSAASVEAQMDLTPTKRFTITSQSEAIAKRVDAPIRITGFVQPGSAEAVELRSLVRQYRNAHVSMTMKIVDPDTQPARARRLGVNGYHQMLVEVKGRRELVDDIGEIPLTSALARLGTASPPLACFTVGHGERDIEDENPGGIAVLGGYLRRLGMETKPLALGAAGGEERLARCSVVVVAGARTAFLAQEEALLARYTETEGRLLVLVDPEGHARVEHNNLLRPWGLTVGEGVVQDRSSLVGDPTAVVAFDYPSSSPPTRALRREGVPVLLAGAAPVEKALRLPEQAAVVPLVASSSKSRVDNQSAGPFILAAVADWSTVGPGSAGPEIARTRVGVVGSVEFASNRLVDELGNRDLATGLIQWVAHQDDVISAGKAVGGVRKVVLTSAQHDRLVRNGVVWPTVCALVPLPVALLRLRRG
jgi:hypothetical protein